MKLDFSSDTDSRTKADSNCENAVLLMRTFFGWQILEKEIIKSEADITFKDRVKIFKDDIKTLTDHIFIKWKQIKANHEIKASLSENDIMLHVDLSESHKNY